MSPKRLSTFNRLHGIITQTMSLFTGCFGFRNTLFANVVCFLLFIYKVY
jgi:hypothetical protein